jgi:hypothetical protein
MICRPWRDWKSRRASYPAINGWAIVEGRVENKTGLDRYGKTEIMKLEIKMKTMLGKSLFTGLVLLALTLSGRAQVAFTLVGNYVAGKSGIGVTMADVNGDGLLDMIISSTSVLILTNNGNGSFGSNAQLTISGTPNYSSVTVADINGDGKVDLMWADGGWPGNIYVFTNNGSGSFGYNAVYAVGNVPGYPIAVDINNNGKLALICANAASKTLSVLTNNGSGGFQLSSSPATGADGGPVSLVAADINNDGKVDLICANVGSSGSGGRTLSVMTNNGSGGFKLASTPGVGLSPGEVVAADINGDGKLELICQNNSDKTQSILTNNGSGVFSLSATLNLSPISIGFSMLDINGDGRPDIITGSYSTNILTVFTNNGSGVFGFNTTLKIGFDFGGLTAADINGDGRLDLFCGISGRLPNLTYTNAVVLEFINVPLLTSKVSNNNLILSWPTSWTNWALLQNADLTTSNWTGFSGPVGNDGTNNTVTNSVSLGNMFFRLGHP